MIDKRLFQLVNKQPLMRLLTLRLTHLLLSIGIWLLIAWLLSSFLQQPSLLHSLAAGAGILLLLAGKTRLQLMMEQSIYDSSAELRITVRKEVMEKAFRLGDTNQQLPAATLSQLAIDGIEQLEIYYARFLPQLFYCVCASLLIFATLVCFAWQPAVVLLIGIPLIPLTIMLVMKIAKKILHRYWGKYTNLGTSFYESLQGFRTLKAFDYDGIKEQEMAQEAEGFRKITMRLLSMQLNSITIMDIISYGGAGLGIGVALTAFIENRLSLMGMILFILLSAEVFIPMRQLGSLFHVAMNGISACKRLFDYLELSETIYGEAQLTETITSISTNSLCYSYDQATANLQDIHIELQRGQLTALVGTSGSGKSTLAKILAGRLPDYQGMLYWNQTDFHQLQLNAIRRRSIFVDNHAYLYPTTIKENLLLVNDQHTEEALWEVLYQVGLADEVASMSLQLDTPLEENGANLSGGQRQRLLVAQALLHDADVYLFDEITSGVDKYSEELLLQTLKRLANEKIVLMVSHRLYNVLDADQVHVLEQGAITATGSPQELRYNNNYFASYFQTEDELLRRSQL